MKRLLVLILYIVLGFMLNRFLKSNPFNSSQVDNMVFKSSSPVQQMLGGDKDEHGCIGSAGYTWCELKGKCLKLWEEPCE